MGHATVERRTTPPERLSRDRYLSPRNAPPRRPWVRLRSRNEVVCWGFPWEYGSAAYWLEATHLAIDDGLLSDALPHRLGADLRLEVVACILGGYGVTFEMASAAFAALNQGVLDEARPSAEQLSRVLLEPIEVSGAMRRYRFPRQRAIRIAASLELLGEIPTTLPDRELRDALATLPGIGPKTASWIVRNQRGCSTVAILDIHVVKAGQAANVFHPGWNPTRDYSLIEETYLEWASIGDVDAGHLDAVIWSSQAAGRRMNVAAEVYSSL
jgi:N-glycosylase/DNA lyase